MRGVSQVTGEAAGGAGVALSARGRHVRAAQVRARIRNREDIMGPVTVIAFCRLGVAKPRDLAVVRVEIGFSDLLVAPPALVHNVEPKASLIGATNGMSSVTVAADGQLFAGFGHLPGVNAVVELLFNTVVALPAG